MEASEVDGWKRFDDGDPVAAFARLAPGEIMRVTEKDAMAIGKRYKSTALYREIGGEAPGFFEVMKENKARDSLPDLIMKSVERSGPTTLGVLANKMRRFKAEDVRVEVRKLLSAGKLDGRVEKHKYNKGAVQHIFMPNWK